jgi:hypothetical protein
MAIIIEKVLKTTAVHSRDEPSGMFGGPGGDELRRMYSCKWVLRIEDAPGSWYLSEFTGRIPQRLALDLGQGWYLENAAEIIREAMELM